MTQSTSQSTARAQLVQMASTPNAFMMGAAKGLAWLAGMLLYGVLWNAPFSAGHVLVLMEALVLIFGFELIRYGRMQRRISRANDEPALLASECDKIIWAVRLERWAGAAFMIIGSAAALLLLVLQPSKVAIALAVLACGGLAQFLLAKRHISGLRSIRSALSDTAPPSDHVFT